MRASMLPTLLAAYRKYGSLAEGWPVAANHFWITGLVAETTKNGSPTEIERTPSSQGIGLPAVGGDQSPGTRMGSVSNGRASSATCRIAWRRTPSFAVVACA